MARELSPEEQSKLESLIDVDAVQQPKFGWDDTYQRRLLGMLLTDRFFLVQSLGKIDPEFFTNQAHVLICKLLMKHFEKHKDLPEKWILQQELADSLSKIGKDKDVVLFYKGQLQELYEHYVPGIQSRDVLLDKITNFAKVQGLKVAFHKCLGKVTEKPEEEGTWDFVYDTLRTAMSIDLSHDPGLEYFVDIEEMFRRMKQGLELSDRFTSGFESIDNAITGGGLTRGEIGAWIGLPGTGKSLACVKAAVANVMRGHKVLYITLEIDETGTAQRFTSQFTNHSVNHLFDFHDEIVQTIESFTADKEDKNMLVVKQFPGGQADVNTIRAFHSQCVIRGFKPDLIIVDYVGEMRDNPNVALHESRYRILRDLRAFGVEERHCTITNIQPNRSAAELDRTQYIDESNIGTSFDQFKPLDAFWSVNQLTIEKDAEVGRGFVIKHRNGKSRFPFYMGFDYSVGTLNIFEITKESYHAKMHEVTEAKAESVVTDTYDVSKGDKKKKKRSKNGFKPDDEGDVAC